MREDDKRPVNNKCWMFNFDENIESNAFLIKIGE